MVQNILLKAGQIKNKIKQNIQLIEFVTKDTFRSIK